MILISALYSLGYGLFTLYQNYYLKGYAIFKGVGNYAEKVERAKDLFLQPPKIPEDPAVAQIAGAKSHGAYYVGYVGGKVGNVYLSEAILKNYNTCELAGMLAHEIAHAERVYAGKPKLETNMHWVVDFRAAELVGKRCILSGLKKFYKHEMEHLRKMRFWFYIYFFDMDKYRQHKRGLAIMKKRIKKLQTAPNI